MVEAAGLVLELVLGDADRVQLLERGPQGAEVPLLREALGRADDVALDGVVDHAADLLLQVRALEHPTPLAVDDLALAAHDVVVLQDVLADLEVATLDLRLGRGDRAGHALVLDRDVVGDLHRLQDPVDPVGLEQPHQVVLERQVEPGLARVALPAGPAAELVVDPPRLVALGADDVQATDVVDLVVLGLDLLLHLLVHGGPGRLVLVDVLDRVETLPAQLLVGEELDRAAEHDVGASTGHVGGDRDGTAPTGLGDDVRLVGVVLRVQHGVRDAAALEQPGQRLGLLDRHGADQDRLALRRAARRCRR